MTTLTTKTNTYRVCFVREFFAGALSGIVVSDSISFPNLESAKRWIDGVSGKSFGSYKYASFAIDCD